MVRVHGKYVEAFCPNCHVVKLFEELKCECESMVPIVSGDSPEAVRSEVIRQMARPKYSWKGYVNE